MLSKKNLLTLCIASIVSLMLIGCQNSSETDGGSQDEIKVCANVNPITSQCEDKEK